MTRMKIRKAVGNMPFAVWLAPFLALAALAAAQPAASAQSGQEDASPPTTATLAADPIAPAGQIPADEAKERSEAEAAAGPAAASEPADEAVRTLRFNFKDAPIQTVLDYLSRVAGFVVVKAVDVSGSVNLESQQPVTPDEAIELLDTVLKEQGCAAIRSGRTLTIVRRDQARTRDVPVRRGNDPNAIAKTDRVVTQIIPVRRTTVKELVDNLRDLLPSDATISSNEKSNAIILTDSEVNIRRIVEIIRALDESISEISSLRVYQLKYADAKDTAEMIQNLFKQPQSSNEGANVQRRFMPPFMRGGGPGGDSGDSSSASGAGSALQASATVTAAADQRTNSVVVSAPEDIIPTIENLITQIDQAAEVMTEVRVFPLKYADAEKTADMIKNVFGDGSQTQSSSQGRNQSNQTFRQRFLGPGGMFGPQGSGGPGGQAQGSTSSNNKSERQETASKEDQ